MASRHLSRSIVLQTLFECDSQNVFAADTAHTILERNLKDFSQGDTDGPFAESLLDGIIAKKKEIDDVMVASAPEWPLEKIASIDRNVLRIGLYELLFADRAAVPPKVALNEAIELAKSYGGDTSGKFVNGVLGAVYRSIGSPGKEEAPKEPTPLPHEHLGGVAVVAVSDGAIEIALVLDLFDRWTLPKAKCLPGELSDSAAKRAMKEDLGVEAEIKTSLGEHEFIAHEPDVGRVVRTVGYFLACTPKETVLKKRVSGGIKDAGWFSESALDTMPVYADLVPVLTAAFTEAKRTCL